MKKIGLLILLCLLNLGAFAAGYFPNSISAPAGATTTYCVGDMNVAYTATVTMCSSTSAATNNITAQWYWNSTLVYTDPTVYTPASTASFTLDLPAGSFALTPAGTYAGALGLEVKLTSSTTPAPAGCTSTPVVNSTPATITVVSGTGPITGLAQVCIGSTITLGNSVPGGVWSITPGVATIDPVTGVVTGTGSGGAGITYTIGGCSSSTSVLSVANPAPITPSSTAVCVGQSTSLTDASPGGSWVSSLSSTALVGSSTGIVTGVSAGVATLSYIYPSSGCYSTATVTVNDNPAAITGGPNVCMAGTAALSDVTPAGTWISGANAIATVGSSTGVVTGMSVGTTLISYRISATGCYTTTPVNVSPAPSAIVGDTVMCAAGNTVTFSNATAGGVWSSTLPTIASISTAGVAASGIAGVTTISYTTPGCNPATKVLTVTPLPATIGGYLGICIGVPSSLYAAVGGGTWISADTLKATVSSAGIISGLSMGTVAITYRMPGGCQTSSIATINPLAPITGTDTVCAGGLGYLEDIIGGGTWASGNPSVLTIDTFSGVMTTLIPGPSYVTYTTSAGCTASKLITVINQIPMISGPDNICTGSTVSLADVVTGGVYSSSNTYIATVNDSTGFFVAGAPGEVSVTYTSTGVGCAVTKVITVQPLPVPVVSFSSMATHTLSTYPYYTSYQWYDSTRGLIPGATTMSLVIPTNKSEYYYVVVTDMYGCVGAYGYNFVSNVGVNNLAANTVGIYPNPATDKVTVSAGVPVKAVISDIAGRTIIDENNAAEINISNIVSGVYVISLYDEQGALLAKKKLVKQ